MSIIAFDSALGARAGPAFATTTAKAPAFAPHHSAVVAAID